MERCTQSPNNDILNDDPTNRHVAEGLNTAQTAVCVCMSAEPMLRSLSLGASHGRFGKYAARYNGLLGKYVARHR